MRISDSGDPCDMDSVGLWRGGKQKSPISTSRPTLAAVYTHHKRGKNTERSEDEGRKVPDVFFGRASTGMVRMSR